MKVIDDGVIKYDRTNFSYLEAIPDSEFTDIEYQRKKLYQLNLIGEDQESKVGFGNISKRFDLSHVKNSPRPQFIITATQTGKFSDLNGTHYTRVLDFDIDNAKIYSMGALEASSEALTHAAIYLANPSIKAIVHVHSQQIWEKMLNDGSPATQKGTSYGTKEMAYEGMRLARNHSSGIFVMTGHEGGIISFSSDINLATQLMIKTYDKYLK